MWVSVSLKAQLWEWFSDVYLCFYNVFSRVPQTIAYNYGYRQVSNIIRTLEGNKIVDYSDVVGASPVGAATTTSSFST